MQSSTNKLSFWMPITRQSFVFQQNDSWQKTAAKSAFWISSIAGVGLAGYLAYQYGLSLGNKTVSPAVKAPENLPICNVTKTPLAYFDQETTSTQCDLPFSPFSTSECPIAIPANLTINTTNILYPAQNTTATSTEDTILTSVVSAVGIALFGTFAFLTAITD